MVQSAGSLGTRSAIVGGRGPLTGGVHGNAYRHLELDAVWGRFCAMLRAAFAAAAWQRD